MRAPLIKLLSIFKPDCQQLLSIFKPDCLPNNTTKWAKMPKTTTFWQKKCQI